MAVDDTSASSAKPGVGLFLYYAVSSSKVSVGLFLYYAVTSSKKGKCYSFSYPCPLQSRGSLISCLNKDMSSEPLLFLASNDLEELAGNRD